MPKYKLTRAEVIACLREELKNARKDEAKYAKGPVHHYSLGLVRATAHAIMLLDTRRK